MGGRPHRDARPTLSRLRRALTARGTAVIVGGEGGGDWTGFGRQLRAVTLSPLIIQRLVMFVLKQGAGDLKLLADFIGAGTVVPRIGSTYPLDQVPAAMCALEAGKVCGKTAITV